MTRHNLQEPLQTFPAMLNHVIAEAVRKHLPRQRRDRDARALALEDVAEVFKIGVTTAHDGVLELEGGDIGPADYLVAGVHAARCTVRLGVSDLVVLHTVNILLYSLCF